MATFSLCKHFSQDAEVEELLLRYERLCNTVVLATGNRSLTLDDVREEFEIELEVLRTLRKKMADGPITHYPSPRTKTVCIEVGARGKLSPHCSSLTSRIGKPAARELRSEMLKFATSTSNTIPKHPLVLASNDFCHF